MKNKILLKLITLIVFFSFTIPDYALSAPAKSFSQSTKKGVPAAEKAVSAPVKVETSGEIPEYKIPESSSADDLAEYTFAGEEVKSDKSNMTSTSNSSSFSVSPNFVVKGFVSDRKNQEPKVS